ncbi:uncharacterized protein LOC144031048 isoform X2 [Festucalex cinctus]
MNLTNRGHYEVHGDEGPRMTPATPVNRAPVLFSLSSPLVSSSSGRSLVGAPRPTGFFRPLQRSIHVAEVVHGELTTSRTVTIRFSQAEATVEGITAKVGEALETECGIILTDSQGNEILDSEATRSIHYWKDNSRKVFVFPESDFQEFQNGRRAKMSRRADDSYMQGMTGQINELKNACESLHGISNSITQLCEMAKYKVPKTLAHPVEEVFTCLVCKAIMDEPTFSTCCGSLVGCGACVRQWLLNADHCLKCRTPGFANNIHSVKGMDSVLASIKGVRVVIGDASK